MIKMPRKKNIQKPPLDSFETIIGSGIAQEKYLVEIRDETCPELGSGKYQTDKFNKLRDRLLSDIVELTSSDRLLIINSPQTFFDWFENTKLADELNETIGYEADTVKGKLYRSIRTMVMAEQFSIKNK
jgi:hypothetical protein